jgi:hypothetical protein
VFSGFSLLSQLPALYLSHSRVAWVACGAAAAFVVALSLRGWGKRVAQASAAAIVVLGLCAAGPAHADERDAFSNDVPAVQSLHGRVAIWRNALTAAREAAPFGAGLGSFAHAFHDAQGRALAKLTPNAAARAYTNATTAHEEYVQTAVESGVLCPAALIATLLLGIVGASRERFFGGAGALVACAIASLGDSPLRQPAIVLLLALVLGTLRGPRTKKRAARSWQMFALLALLVACAWSFTRSARAWLGTRTYLASFAADPDARLRMLSRSERMDPSAGEPHFERGLLLLSAGDPLSALTELDVASERMTDTGIFCARGEAHLALEQDARAESDYRDALAWNAGSLRARVGLATSLHRQGKDDDAEANAKIAKRLSPGAPEVRDLLDAIRESRTDEEH